jgi:ribonuclease P protein component
MGHIGRIVRSSDFERVLRCPPRAKTQHFAVHHLAEMPSRADPPKGASHLELSTRLSCAGSSAVDESVALTSSTAALEGRWLGLVVPKRHARRSVTRNLLKRGIRAAMAAHGALLDDGLWVVRLRATFDKTTFPSASSPALQRLAGLELAQALRQASGTVPRARRAGAQRG